MTMKAVYVLVPVLAVIEEDQALLISKPTLKAVNEAYQEFGAYQEKDVALVDLMCSEMPNAEWVEEKR
jgi:hypothetical protein